MSTQDIITRVIDNRLVDSFIYLFKMWNKTFLCCYRLSYEKRNKKKEAKEAAAYETFQKLNAENRQESSAVNIEQE